MRLMLGTLLMLLVCQTVLAEDLEHVVWDKSPINVHLPIEKERRIAFPGSVALVHNELEGVAIIQKTKDTFYLKALTSFDPKSVVVRLLPEGHVIKLNVTANSTYQNTNALEIVTEETSSAKEPSSSSSNSTPINAITLTRFAIQSLYAPERVLEMPEGVGRVPMNTRKTVSLVRGASVMAHPLASFGGEGLNVTAIRLTNLLSKQQALEPGLFYGHWESIAFYPTNQLMPKGQVGDETVVFVTSYTSFGEALNEREGYVR